MVMMKTRLKSAVDDTVDSLSKLRRNTGLIIGVIMRGQRSIYSYGMVGESRAQSPQGNTLFGIGSITKIFTTALLSVMVTEGRLNLEDSVCDLMPALSKLPSDMTLLRLATHTAGLPKMPSNIVGSMLRDRRNPYAAYTRDNLLEWLLNYGRKKTRLSTGEIRYSNVGMALLGHVLAHKANESYEQAVINRVCAPFGLNDTRITLSPAQKERLSDPHSSRGKPSRLWEVPAFAGAGALFSTADDMLGFINANLDGSQSKLTNSLQACHVIHADNFSPPGYLPRLVASLFGQSRYPTEYHRGVALGWFVGQLREEGKDLYWHHGATGGYRAFVGFVKDVDAGVVVLANSEPSGLDGLLSTTSTDSIGFEILEFLSSVHD